MSARPRSRSPFSRGRLVVGLVLVSIVGGGAAFGLSKLSSGPDPGRLVYAARGGVFERELATGVERRLGALPRDTLNAWPDPDGRWLGYLRRRGDLWLLDLETGARWRVADRLTTGRGWTPDGRFVAAELLSDRDLVAIDPEDRGTDLLVEGFLGSSLVWVDDGRFLSSVGNALVLVDVADGSDLNVIAEQLKPLAISPDGAEVLYATVGTTTPRLAIAKLGDDRLPDYRTVFDGVVRRAAVSAQGFVAFAGRDSAKREGTWVLESRDRPARRIGDEADAIAWSRDGSSLLLLADGNVSAVDLRARRTIRLTTKPDIVAFAVVP